MKITDITAVQLKLPNQAPPSKNPSSTSVTSPQAALGHPESTSKTKPRRPAWSENAEVANPMSRYPHVKAHRSKWLPKWGAVWCKVTLEDGTFGLGCTSHGRPAPGHAPPVRVYRGRSRHHAADAVVALQDASYHLLAVTNLDPASDSESASN